MRRREEITDLGSQLISLLGLEMRIGGDLHRDLDRASREASGKDRGINQQRRLSGVHREPNQMEGAVGLFHLRIRQN